VPQTYRNVPPSDVYVTTTNSNAINAWQTRTVETGDPIIDQWTSAIGVSEIGQQFGNPGGSGSSWYFVLHEANVYDEDALNDELSTASTMLSPPQMLPRDDGTWAWDPVASTVAQLASSTAHVDFTFGWGDCMVACDGFHSLRAVIPPDGNAQVFDLGGDPLPPGIQLSPNTKPPP
jgi:hypothetical protein